jgi:predicted transcriptional regulator/transcriptional regulator with XRE-family HTH domain
MDRSILGTRIRQRRREIGITQTALASSAGISASYLNLIEWNKRPIAGTLLRKIAGALELKPDELDGTAEGRLVESLTEIAQLPALQALGVEDERTYELIGRFPGWARGMAALTRSEREATTKARILSDRLSNDPFLSETVHRMLTRIAAVRSAAEILSDYTDVPAERRDRFNQIIFEESRALSDVGEALAAYLDKSGSADSTLTPLDEVETLFDSRDNHFAEIETASRDLIPYLTDPQPLSRRVKARALVEGRLTGFIEALIKDQSQITTAAARARAQRALTDYAITALLMPMDLFATQAQALRYDLEALADAFSTEMEVVCHRLAALPRAEDSPRFGYFQANAAGTIIEMLGLEGLAIPRYVAACPLWVLYRAQQSPEAVIRQRALFPSGARFVFVARARHTGPTGFGKPRHYITDMLAMSEADARQTVYAPDASTVVEEVGPSCRLCPRQSCTHRVEDPLAE